MKFVPNIADSIVVYRSQTEKMADEANMRFLEENATWLYPTILVGFGLFFLAIAGFVVYNFIQIARFNRKWFK